MKNDELWQSFFETGDPVRYLLAKKLERPPRRDREKDGTGEEPRPED